MIPMIRRWSAFILVALILTACASAAPRGPRPAPPVAVPSPPPDALAHFAARLDAALANVAAARGDVEAALGPGVTIRVRGATSEAVTRWLHRQRDQLDAIAAALLATRQRLEQARRDGMLIEAPSGAFQGGLSQ